MRRAIWWIRRDLRLTDNQALKTALDQSDEVIPVFILDPKLIASPYVGDKRKAFLFDGLRSLDHRLRSLEGYLVIRHGSPLEELERLVTECGAEAIFAEQDVSPFASKRDTVVSQRLQVTFVDSPAVRPPGMVIKPDGSPYTLFAAFSRAWKALPGLPEYWSGTLPARVNTPGGIHSLGIPERPVSPPTSPFQAGEEAAQRRLSGFIDSQSVYEYAAQRNRLDCDGTSQLSPYLRFGMVSPRQVASAAIQAIQAAPDDTSRKCAGTWLNELIWRDYYNHILYHFPQVRRGSFRLKHVQWEGMKDHFLAWCDGCTGYPVVDAAMRQLVETGWMHNRSRMIVASFLTKDLLIDWRQGELFFMQHLIDGDPAANNGGWQWIAGTGADAAPYFRIFNPVSQSIKHDPGGHFIRRWLPELALVPDEFIHEPWKMPAAVQQAAGCVIGVDYPAPIVDHSAAKERALLAYRKEKPNV